MTKKREQKKSEEPSEEKPEENQEFSPAETEESSLSQEKKSRELYWILGVMVGLIIIFFLASSVFQSFRTFTYEGLTFSKEFLGEIPYYRYSYNSKITPNAINPTPINLVLRIDPRENTIPIDGEIEFPYGNIIYITVSGEGITQCPYSTLSIGSMGSFLASNGLSIKGATQNETEAEEFNLLHVTCDTFPGAPTIAIQSGEETRITRDENRCYTIEVADCEILPAVEKLMVQSLLDARKRADF